MPSLTTMLSLQLSDPSDGVLYRMGGQQLMSPERESAVAMLADDAVRIRCGATPLTESWRARRDGGAAHAPGKLRVLETYLGLGFGLPSKPAPPDHLQGLVAELFWGRLLEEATTTTDGRRLHFIHPPKPDPLEPGGDGLVIYSLADGTFVFRLWEIKKYDGKDLATSAVSRASTQLKTRGSEYLAKLAGPETMTQGGPLGELYTDMVELWHDRSPLAGTGVAVGASQQHISKGSTPFTSLTVSFPEFAAWGQREGLLIAIPDFPEFARDVRKAVWSGL